MTISVGDIIPAVDLNILGPDGPGPISTDDIFSGKTVAVFGLPGAFTRTCSARHLPGFVDNADALKAKGVDAIVCIAVNDAFVMGAWGTAQDVGDKVMMVADGSAKFTQATGLEADMSAKGFGVRCQRFSMVVEDGTVKSLQIDEPGTFEVSSAEVMLGEL
jgi:peroxiredoxin (alkyl hydroperoxide reductase subunit C)